MLFPLLQLLSSQHVASPLVLRLPPGLQVLRLLPTLQVLRLPPPRQVLLLHELHCLHHQHRLVEVVVVALLLGLEVLRLLPRPRTMWFPRNPGLIAGTPGCC